MNVIVFTDKKPIKVKLESLSRARIFNLSFAPSEEVKEHLSSSLTPSLYYLDTGSFSQADIVKLIKSSAGKPNKSIGIVDPTGVITDMAPLFYEGAVDYLGKEMVKNGVASGRIKKAIDYCGKTLKPEVPKAPEAKMAQWKLSGDSWAGIRGGTEYTFCFMFIELDLSDNLKTKSGKAHLDAIKGKFQKHIEQVIAPLSGRIWMWMDLGGLVLFPFDGESCRALLRSFMLVLNRTIISAEVYDFQILITYRIAIHIGNTIYRRRGNTGDIISDTVNFIFHLGQKYAKPGELYVTEPVFQFIPKGLLDCFLTAGTFEGIPVQRMRLPVES